MRAVPAGKPPAALSGRGSRLRAVGGFRPPPDKKGKHMEKNTTSWVRLPLAVLQDKRLTPYEAVILSVLIDRDTGTGASVSIRVIAEATGIGERKVRECLHLLRDTGYIDIVRTGRESIYTVAQILPPKKRGTGQAQYTSKKKKKADENAFCDMNHFEEDYEIFINNF